MNNNQEKLNQLLTRLEYLEKKQVEFFKEVDNLKQEIKKIELKGNEDIASSFPDETVVISEVLSQQPPTLSVKGPVIEQERVSKPYNEPKRIKPSTTTTPSSKSNLEKFIGENLISKIGIVITVIGVAIGAKYAIDHQIISPLARIILGYIFGLAMLGTGVYLKKNFLNFSAVLVSGALAIMYFITFASYSFYQLIPQVLAFAMMVVFTSFAVAASLNYNRQVIALIGLVGAYAVPFLLSDGSGRVAVLFTYTAIINIGILIIAFHKYWKPLYYSAFIFTWLIYASWFLFRFSAQKQIALAFSFLTVFFLIFYLIFLAFKVLQKEKLNIGDVLLVLSNSFIFYGFGYSLVNDIAGGEKLLGFFTLANAVIHFIVAALIYRKNLGDKQLLYFVSGLVLIFITIAIPVQLDGNWVTLLWVGEAALLFWIGRAYAIKVYEKIAYPLMILAFFSIIHDWALVYDNYNPDYPDTRVSFLLNIQFLSSVLFMMAFAFMNYFNRKAQYHSALTNDTLKIMAGFMMGAILVIVSYFSFRLEIANYWEQLFTDSSLVINNENQDYPSYYYNYSLRDFKVVWLINYSLLFFALVSFINISKIKSQVLTYLTLIINFLLVFVFLFSSLYYLSDLRETYINKTLGEYYNRGIMHIAIRYISLLFFGLLMMAFYKTIRANVIRENLNKPFILLTYLAVLWVASSELLHWMDLAGSTQSYKLGLSILWGVYALLMVALGIWKKKSYLRVAAIVLFGGTLLKLFFYDIAHLDTIAKTIVFVSLGLLLLGISFLYNKYRHLISEEEKMG